MRNGQRLTTRRFLFIGLLAASTMALCLQGCHHEDPKIQEDLDGAEVALAGHRYEVAVAKATEMIALHPTAEAYYLRGRAEEDRGKIDQQVTLADQAKAMKDYNAALGLSPTPQLESRLHNQLANIAFYQNDYPTALFQWTQCVDQLEPTDARPHAMYEMGISQQRIGNFEEADHTFLSVQQKYPSTRYAGWAADHVGVRSFFVQLGSFTSASDAGKALKAAQAAGLQAVASTKDGNTAILVGPYDSFARAEATRVTWTNQYPDATIVP
jgi:tetratricopeptide (TPR) repeat protein